MLTRRGAPIAAVIPIEALAILERAIETLEDEIDLREARRILADPGSEFLDWEEAKRELDQPDETVPPRRRAKGSQGSEKAST